jgi:hypothetical protein
LELAVLVGQIQQMEAMVQILFLAPLHQLVAVLVVGTHQAVVVVALVVALAITAVQEVLVIRVHTLRPKVTTAGQATGIWRALAVVVLVRLELMRQVQITDRLAVLERHHQLLELRLPVLVAAVVAQSMEL